MKNTSSNLPLVASVEFHGTHLITIQKDDVELVAMKPVVEGIGLAWQKQHEKLSRDKDKFSYHLMVTTGKDGKKYEMLCMPITKLNGWLFSINPNKIPNPDVRQKVIEYQEECFIALYNYWHKGVAVRPQSETLTPSEQHQITKAVKEKAGDNHKAIPEIWGRIKNKFKVAKYSQLKSGQLQEVIEYINAMDIRTVQPVQPALLSPHSEEYYKNRIETLEERVSIHKDTASFYSSIYKDLLAIMIDLFKNRMSRS